MQIETASVLRHESITADYRLLVMDCAGVADVARPGQFVHLRVPGQEHLVLRRPFSIFKAESGQLSLLYKSVGEGTRAMQEMIEVGHEVSVMGPLGVGFPTDHADTYPVLVGGGYGIAALYMLAKELPVKGVVATGGRTAADILVIDEFAALGWETLVATEDGSLGVKGLVTDVLNAWLAGEGAGNCPEFYVCGPDGMLKAVSEIAIAHECRAWISMDRHMACGVGACLACVHKVRAESDGEEWARACKDGPVFECRQMVW